VSGLAAFLLFIIVAPVRLVSAIPRDLAAANAGVSIR